MKEYNSVLQVEIIVSKESKLFNNMSYGLIFHKIESVEIDAVLVLPDPQQKILSSKKLRQVKFKSYNTLEDLEPLKLINQRFRIMDYEENKFAGKGKVLEIK